MGYKTMSHKKQQTNHTEILKRLKRAKGHMETVIRMIEDERECVDVARQLHAVSKAIIAAKSTYIHNHIEHCLADDHDGLDVKEIRELTKYIS